MENALVLGVSFVKKHIAAAPEGQFSLDFL